MNNLQIVNQAIPLNDMKPIPMPMALIWLQEACSLLASRFTTAMVNVSTNLTCVDTDIYLNLPSDCISVKSVIDSNNEKYNGYLVSEGKISFDKPDKFTINYERYPVIVIRNSYETEINTDVPEINTVYHSCLSYYIASMAIYIRNPEDKRVISYEDKFFSMADDINSRMSKPKTKGARIKAPKWR